MNTITIDCDLCVMRSTPACSDCLVTHLLEHEEPPGQQAVVIDLAEERALRWFAEAGMVPTLRHRAASNA